jgi:ABC-type glycerol-3-phosphate transport system permease component
MKSKSGTMRVLVIGMLVVLSLAYLLPIYVTVVTSLKSIQESSPS